MKKRILGFSIALVFILSSFAGCGSSVGGKNNASGSAPAEGGTQSADYVLTQSDGYGADTDNEDSSPELKKSDNVTASSLTGTGSSIDTVNNAILAERKIIRSANLSIEVENFDEARGNINSIINGIGIIQESNVITERIYIDDELKLLKRGNIVLRVYKDKFDSVFNNLKGIGDVTSETINGHDVTDQFVDTESRLRLLKLEQERLEEYLVKLNDLDQIFRTESRLTEIRHEIENLTVNLNKMNSLVELSTISISMNEKNPYENKKPVKVTYWQELLENLESSLEGIVRFLGDLLIFIVAIIPVLLVIGLFGLVCLLIYRSVRKRIRNKSASGGIQEQNKTHNNETDSMKE